MVECLVKVSMINVMNVIHSLIKLFVSNHSYQTNFTAITSGLDSFFALAGVHPPGLKYIRLFNILNATRL